jgi:uncharacterized membrane protein
MLKQLKDIFGGDTKWVLIGVIAFLAILAIVLFTFVVENIQWILLGCGIALILAVVGIVVYKKEIEKKA